LVDPDSSSLKRKGSFPHDGKSLYICTKTLFVIYLPEALFDAFSGFTRIVWTIISGLACVAKLQIPLRHFAAGFA
jgi:hypothetical protein